jgi:hypothetical protein
VGPRAGLEAVEPPVAIPTELSRLRNRPQSTVLATANSTGDKVCESNNKLSFQQPLTEMSIRRIKKMFLGIRALPVCKADNLTAICNLTV